MKRTQRILLWLSVVLITLSLMGCQTLFKPHYSVRRVSDGDTLTVTDSKGVDIKVRFACVDAPEVPHTKKERDSYSSFDRDQYKWGRLARNRLNELISQANNNVTLTITDSDKYGRKIAEVRLPDGTLVQEVLAREGLAMVYRQYMKSCPSATVVEQSEEQARREQAGIWRDPQFTPPWEYRQKSRVLTKRVS